MDTPPTTPLPNELPADAPKPRKPFRPSNPAALEAQFDREWNQRLPRLVEEARQGMAQHPEMLAAEGAGPSPVGRDKLAVIVLGNIASGKSRISVPLEVALGARPIDANMAQEQLPEYIADRTRTLETQEEAQHIVQDRVMPVAIARGENLIYHRLGADSRELANTVATLRLNGYQVYAVDVRVPVEVAARRAIKRWKDPAGGRWVDPMHVYELADRSSLTYNRLKAQGLVDGYAAFDNAAEDRLRVIEMSKGLSALLPADSYIVARKPDGHH